MAAKLKDLQRDADAAKAKLDQLHADALSKFESSDAFKAAYAAFDQQRQDLKGPTDQVLDQLAQTRDFQDLMAAAQNAKATEDKLHADKNASPQAIKAAEQAFMDADNKVHDAEEKALAADPTIAARRDKVDAAQDKLREMRDRMEEDLQKDPTFAAALEDLHKRESAITTATADRRKLDAQVADLQSKPAPQPTTVAADNRDALRAAEARLDSINADLERATQDLTKLQARVNEDRPDPRYAQQQTEPVRQPLDRDPVVIDRRYDDAPVARPYYPPVVTVYPPPTIYYYDYPARDYYDGGIYFSLGYSSYYRDRYYRHDDRGYDRGYDRSYDRDRQWGGRSSDYSYRRSAPSPDSRYGRSGSDRSYYSSSSSRYPGSSYRSSSHDSYRSSSDGSSRHQDSSGSGTRSHSSSSDSHGDSHGRSR